jgi:hypothetical protein
LVFVEMVWSALLSVGNKNGVAAESSVVSSPMACSSLWASMTALVLAGAMDGSN